MDVVLVGRTPAPPAPARGYKKFVIPNITSYFYTYKAYRNFTRGRSLTLQPLQALVSRFAKFIREGVVEQREESTHADTFYTDRERYLHISVTCVR